MTIDDALEFAGYVRLRLIEHDYAILRGYQGRSAFRVFLAAVIARMLYDYRAHEFGKWHDSSEAQRIGPAAIDLERKIYRDGLPPEQALAVVASQYSDLTTKQLHEIVDRLPNRVRRRFVTLDEAASIGTEPDVREYDREALAKRISGVVRDFVSKLPEADRKFLGLLFGSSNKSIASIAGLTRIDQKRLYRHRDTLFRQLRAALQEVGINRDDIEDVIGHDVQALDFFSLQDDGAENATELRPVESFEKSWTDEDVSKE